jgi:hypothetical protein
VAGQTIDTDFPTTPGAFQPNNTSGALTGGAVYGAGFVTKLSATGSALVYSTYLGGTVGNGDTALGIAVDAASSAYVTGITFDTDFPTTPGAFQTSPGGGGFVTKLNPSGSAPVYSTFLGAGRAGIALDSSGDAYVTGGADVSELNASGSAQLFSMTLSGSSGKDGGAGIALDNSGNVYVAGNAYSTNFPTTPGAFQTTDPISSGFPEPFVAKINVVPSPSFAVTGYPSPTTAGVAHNFTVTALNADGTVNTGYTGTVHFTSNDLQAALPADYTFTTGAGADNGVHTFTATLKTAGTQSITATDTATGSITGIESGIVVKPAAATKFVLSAPSSAKSGAKFSVTLTVEDAYGNVVTGYTGTVHFSSSDSKATLPKNYTFTSSDAGVHTFSSAFILKKTGTDTITVTDIVNSALTATDSISVG